ncbi:hypothetical protein [Brevibacillus sedimenti]|mgnify:CR=1 FL=1|jgi:hypothetical protein|uniref:hypothetical protein n=2 Tax=Brevibacillus TaxID=55080 RepID=UPI000E39941A|nr:hypothetical protein [Anoxybacillus sediminis]MBR8660388.1 hypothetical protein [Brevibacillus sp. NL20B1]NNV03366.1 hypothetical protein [Brevibacillus sp. MCWH]REK63850.1 MAG: hypothetical protein DF221_10090 [Brevibacillus sp.]UFJ61860.1 hypothetical protein IRT44_03150 [Anoxybacillus sediminis]
MMSRKFFFVTLLAVSCLLSSCTQEVSTQEFYVVKNEGSYESYWDNSYQNLFILNLAFNHSPDLELNQSDIESIELLPHTDLVKIEKFIIEENPPQGTLKQKALFVHLLSQRTGTHTFNQIAFHTKYGRKVMELGNININVHKGVFSGVMPLGKNIGVFPVSTPLTIFPRNDNDYPVIIKGILLHNPYITYDRSDIKILVDNKEVPLPTDGVKLNPKEQLQLTVYWKVNFPPNQIINIEARPLLISERQGNIEYADIPNMIFRNDFKLPAN